MERSCRCCSSWRCSVFAASRSSSAPSGRTSSGCMRGVPPCRPGRSGSPASLPPFAHMPRRRVGRREAEVSQEHASEDRLIELYIEHCMPPPPWIRWDPSHMLGLEWKLAVLESRPSQYSPVELSRLRCADEWDTLTGGEPGRPLDNNAAFEYSGRRLGGDAPYVHQLLNSPPPAGASDFSDPLPEWDSPEWRHFCKCPHEWTISSAHWTLRECTWGSARRAATSNAESVGCKTRLPGEPSQRLGLAG